MTLLRLWIFLLTSLTVGHSHAYLELLKFRTLCWEILVMLFEFPLILFLA